MNPDLCSSTSSVFLQARIQSGVYGKYFVPVSHIDNFSITRQERIANTLLTVFASAWKQIKRATIFTKDQPAECLQAGPKDSLCKRDKGYKTQSRVHTTL